MHVFDDAARKGQSYAPASRFRADAGFEEAVPHFDADARSVVFDYYGDHAALAAHDGVDTSATAAQCVNGISDQRLYRPLEQHGITGYHRAG